MVAHAALIGANLLTLVVILVNLRLQWQVNAAQQEVNAAQRDINRLMHASISNIERELHAMRRDEEEEEEI